MVRISQRLGYSSLDDFRKNECLKVVFHESSGPPGSLPLTSSTVSGWCLKRSVDEAPEDSASGKPLRCRFLNPDNLCTIYPVRPSSCRIWPYAYGSVNGEVKVVYCSQNDVECKGFLEKNRTKKQILAQPALEIKRHLAEVQETIERGLFQEKVEEVRFDFLSVIQKQDS